MDWNAENDRDRQAMQRIIALLVALAALADSACARSPFVRGFVLSILRRGELFAREFIIQEAQASGVPYLDLPVPDDDGSSVDDAMHLAACFRALAIALASIWTQALCPARQYTPRHVLLSNRSNPAAHVTHHLPRTKRGLGFRALDSPQRRQVTK